MAAAGGGRRPNAPLPAPRSRRRRSWGQLPSTDTNKCAIFGAQEPGGGERVEGGRGSHHGKYLTLRAKAAGGPQLLLEERESSPTTQITSGVLFTRLTGRSHSRMSGHRSQSDLNLHSF